MNKPLLQCDSAGCQGATDISCHSRKRAVPRAMVALGSIIGLLFLVSLLVGSKPEVHKLTSPIPLEAVALQAQDLSKWGKFLRDQKELLSRWSVGEEHVAPDVTLVVGNEASDADSIITALTYAYLKAELDKRSDRPRVYFPIIKCKKNELRLRQETLFIFKAVGVDPNDAIHPDEDIFAPLQELVDNGDPRLQFILTDHNRADGLLKGHAMDRVVEIIDHHQDQQWHHGAEVTLAFDERTHSATAASACTLVANKYFASAEGRSLLEDDAGAVASALLAVIVIDSADLHGATAEDRTVVRHMEALVPDVLSKPHLQFKVLNDYKQNPVFWASASLEENLVYDFKQFTAGGLTCGISATFLSLATLEEKMANPADVSALEEYVQDPHNPDPDAEVQSTMFMIMLKREPWHLVVASKVDGMLTFSRGFLAGEEASILGLEEVGEDGFMRFYRQRNEKASRKQVGPVCQALLRAFASSPGTSAEARRGAAA